LLIGANPTDAHPVFGSRMKKRLREGAKIIVADPRRIDLVRAPHVEAAHHLPVRPVPTSPSSTRWPRDRHRGSARRKVPARALRERRGLPGFHPAPENSPEATAEITGIDPADLRAAARLYATGGNGAIYYGLGVTEHSQGSTMVMGMANLAMLTGNIGREGVGVNPLRGQNNVQGSCDMGSFPHELPGYRHVSGRRGARDLRAVVGHHAAVRAGAAHPQHVRLGAGRHLPRTVRAG
jgi:formate dehydrogenase major subunit